MASAMEAPATSDELRRVLAATTELDRKTAQWAELQHHVKRAVANAPNVVKLNVGGAIFETSKATLLRVEDSYFHAWLSSGHWKPDNATNAHFLDMDPTLFRRVLFYLRTGALMQDDGLSKVERDEVKAMMQYLNVWPWGVAPQVIRWDGINKSPYMTLSNDFRTVEKSSHHSWGGVIATEALEGAVRVRVDGVTFFVGLCPMAGFDCKSVDKSSEHCYRYCAHGGVYKKQARMEKSAMLRRGDVVTIQRCAGEVIFTVNDGAPVPLALDDPHEELFPVVFLCAFGAKVEVVE